jgi:hypothetical protein
MEKWYFGGKVSQSCVWSLNIFKFKIELPKQSHMKQWPMSKLLTLMSCTTLFITLFPYEIVYCLKKLIKFLILLVLSIIWWTHPARPKNWHLHLSRSRLDYPHRQLGPTTPPALLIKLLPLKRGEIPTTAAPSLPLSSWPPPPSSYRKYPPKT